MHNYSSQRFCLYIPGGSKATAVHCSVSTGEFFDWDFKLFDFVLPFVLKQLSFLTPFRERKEIVEIRYCAEDEQF